MLNPTLKPSIFNPTDRELVDFVMRSACQHFDINEERLRQEATPAVANIRFLCYWLIAQNTHLKDYMIGQAFDKTRGSVLYGVALVEVHKNIYKQTLDNLRSIARIADNFTKNYSWDLQPINTPSSLERLPRVL